jgi:hypothetical protein
MSNGGVVVSALFQNEGRVEHWTAVGVAHSGARTHYSWPGHPAFRHWFERLEQTSTRSLLHLLAHGQSKRSVTASTANIPASGGSFVRIFQKHFVIEDGACRASHLHLT